MKIKKTNLNLHNKMETKSSTEILSGNELQNFFDGVEPTQTTEEPQKVGIESFFEEPTNDEPAPEVKDTLQTPEEKPQPTNFYSNLLQEYIEDGEWVDGNIDIENENGEVETVLISEIKSLTPELFKQIRAGQKDLKKQELESNYVSVEGLDDTTKEMIKLKKAGGDIRELLQVESEMVHPLKNLDLDNEDVQAYIVYTKYLNLSGGDEDIARAKVEKLRSNMQLDLEANKVVEEINGNFKAQVDAKAKEQEEYNKQAQENQKVFKKSMTDTFRSLGLKDTLVKNLVDNTAKFDENGLSNVDKMFFEAKKNPELFAKISFMLSDDKAFDEFYGTKIKNSVKSETVTSLFRISPKTASQSAAPKKENKIDEFLNN